MFSSHANLYLSHSNYTISRSRSRSRTTHTWYSMLDIIPYLHILIMPCAVQHHHFGILSELFAQDRAEQDRTERRSDPLDSTTSVSSPTNLPNELLLLLFISVSDVFIRLIPIHIPFPLPTPKQHCLAMMWWGDTDLYLIYLVFFYLCETALPLLLFIFIPNNYLN